MQKFFRIMVIKVTVFGTMALFIGQIQACIRSKNITMHNKICIDTGYQMAEEKLTLISENVRHKGAVYSAGMEMKLNVQQKMISSHSTYKAPRIICTSPIMQMQDSAFNGVLSFAGKLIARNSFFLEYNFS